MNSDWTAVVQAWTAIIALLVAVAALVWQAYTHSRQVQLTLFDRRYEVYETVWRLLFRREYRHDCDLRQYYDLLRPSRFLFGDDVHTFVYRALDDMTEWYSHDTLVQTAIDQDVRTKAKQDKAAVEQKLLRMTFDVHDVFAPYLDVNASAASRLSRLQHSVKQWADGVGHRINRKD